MMEALPLEKQETEVVSSSTDKVESISVLNKKLCKTKIPRCLYNPIPSKLLEGDVSDYSTTVEKIISNLNWVLSLPHAKFWCQVIHDDSLHATLNSYLKSAPRYQCSDWPSSFRARHDQLHKLVFMVFLRMSTHKESANSFITPREFGILLYHNFLFDIPRIIDLCSLYGNDHNKPLLKKLVESIFKNQESYFQDLRQAADVVIEALGNVEGKVAGVGTGLKVAARPGTIGDKKMDPLTKLSNEEFCDVVLYVSDAFTSLNMFLGEVFPKACTPYFEARICDKLPLFHSLITKDLRKGLRKHDFDEEQSAEIGAHLNLARKSLVSLTKAIISNALLQPIIDSSLDPITAEHHCTNYYHTLHSFIHEKKFVEDLTRKDCQILDGLRRVSQVCPEAARALEARQVLEVFQAQQSKQQHRHMAKENVNGKVVKRQKECLPSKAAQKESDEDMKLIEGASFVLEIFPDLSMDFVKSCLRYYESDTEKLTQALLENNLPPHLENLKNGDGTNDDWRRSNGDDVAGPSGMAGPSTSGVAGSSSGRRNDFDDSLLRQRRNVFDGDEYDAFGSRFDPSRVHRRDDERPRSLWKEKVGGESARSEVERIKRLYDTRPPSDDDEADGDDDAEEDDVIPVNPNYVCSYDDERDDHGDDYDVGVDDSTDQAEGEKQQQNSNNSSRWEKRGGDFVRNPEVVRREREEKRQQQYQQRGGGGGRGRGGRPSSSNQNQTPHSKDEGGDDKKKQQQNIDRRRKDQNKARRGNHNRKVGATRKMQSAMR